MGFLFEEGNTNKQFRDWEHPWPSPHTSRPAVRYILLAEPRQARMPLPSGLSENVWFSEYEKKRVDNLSIRGLGNYSSRLLEKVRIVNLSSRVLPKL